MAVIKLASFDGGGGVGVRAGRAFSQQYHTTLMYGWEFLGDPTVEVPQELLSRIEYLPDEDESTEYDLTDSERRKWLAAFAKEYAHSEELRQPQNHRKILTVVLKQPRVSKIHRLLRMMERRKKIIPHPKVKVTLEHLLLVKTAMLMLNPVEVNVLMIRRIPMPIKKVRVLGLNSRKEKVLVFWKIPMPIKKVKTLVVIPARSPTR